MGTNVSHTSSRRPAPEFEQTWICSKCSSKNRDNNYSCSRCDKIRTPMNKRDMHSTNTSVKAVVRPMSVAVRKRSEADESNAEKIFQNVIAFCRENKSPFVDDQFPPSARSLGKSYGDHVAQWLPLANIAPSTLHERNLPWTIYSSPEPHDIHQGELGNCWLMAAIALITERPQMLQHILLTKKVNAEGVYLVRICHNGLWKILLLDGNFPCTSYDTLAYSRAARRQLYVPLIEKACAKLFGSYANLSGGTTAEGLQLLTGAPCNRISLHPFNETFDADMVWAKLLSAAESKLLIGASTGCEEVDEQEYELVGLNPNHAFTVLLAVALPVNDDRFLLLRDPHGTTKYSEDWLSPANRTYLRSMYHDAPNSTGVFWIAWLKFLHLFDSITISTYVSNHFDIREESQFTRSAVDPVNAYYFTVSTTSSISVSVVYHRQGRKQNSRHTQSFVICDVEEATREYGTKEVILESRRGAFTYWNGSLRPGAYVIIPFSTSFWRENNKRKEERSASYTLVIHSSIHISGVLIKEPPTLLADCLIAATVKFCEKRKEGYCSVFYATPSRYDDKLIVIENQLVNDYLSFSMTLTEGSSVIRHSRYSFNTIDCIPPRHRQLICILEWNHERGETAHMSYVTSQQISAGWHGAIPMIALEKNDLHSPRPF